MTPREATLLSSPSPMWIRNLSMQFKWGPASDWSTGSWRGWNRSASRSSVHAYICRKILNSGHEWC